MTMMAIVKKIALIILGTIVIGTLVTYEYILPEHSGDKYLSTIHASAKKTKPAFEKLAGTFDIVSSLSSESNPAKRSTNTLAVRHAIAEARNAVASFEKANIPLQYYPLSGYFAKYRTATVTQKHANDFVVRSKTAINAYDDVVTQSDAYAAALDAANTVYTTFDSVPNINTYAGQSGLMRQNAGILQQSADTIRTMKLPEAYEQSRKASIDALTQGASGFLHLADALDTPTDAAIYGAVHEIEAANLALDAATQDILRSQLEASRTVKDIDDLVETIDYLTD